MATEPSNIPPVPPITPAGLADPIWPRWLRLVRAKLGEAVTNLQIATAHGFAGTVDNASAELTTISLTTTASGILKGSAGSLTSATPGVDYVRPSGLIDTAFTSTITGLYKGQSGHFARAIPGVDYVTPSAYIACYSSANQSAALNTRTRVLAATASDADRFSVVSTGIQCAADGVFNYQFSLQLSNPSTTVDDVTVWLVLNGTDVPFTSSICTVPAKHGSLNGTAILAVNFLIPLTAGDIISLYWANSTGTTTLAAQTPVGITAPISPSVVITITQVYP